MTKYKKLKQKYGDLIKQTLEQNKQILIESFVEYYGEEYRKLIEKRYNEITFVYYIAWDAIDCVIDNYILYLKNASDYQEFITLSNSRLETSIFSKLSKRLKSSNSLPNMPNNYIGSTNQSILTKKANKKTLLQIIKDMNVACFTSRGETYTDRIVCFPILLYNEIAIIHEINHALTIEDLAYVIEENKYSSTIRKVGLNIRNVDGTSHNNTIEELINEKASREIAEIFKRRGGSLLPFCKDIPIICYIYEENLYLIDDFYGKYKEYIKTARISENTNALIERVGKENYGRLVELVESSYTEDTSIISQIKPSILPQLQAIIEQMETKEKPSSNITEEQLQAYYVSLRKHGYKVKVLEENSSNTLHSDSSSIKVK